MSIKQLFNYLVLFLISLVIVSCEAGIPVETAARIAAITSLLKGTAVLLLDIVIKDDDK